MRTTIDLSSDTPIIIHGDDFYLSYSISRYIHSEQRHEIGQYITICEYPLYPMIGYVLKIQDDEFVVVEEKYSERLQDLNLFPEFVKFMDLLEYYNITTN